MFFVGILGTPLPYLLCSAFYLIGVLWLGQNQQIDVAELPACTIEYEMPEPGGTLIDSERTANFTAYNNNCKEFAQAEIAPSPAALRDHAVENNKPYCNYISATYQNAELNARQGRAPPIV